MRLQAASGNAARVRGIPEEARVRQTNGHPILINGLIYGLIIVVIGLINTGLRLAGIKITDTATSFIVTGVLLIIELALFFLAGRSASAQTGTVGAGALAGLLAAAISGTVGGVISVVQAVIDPAALRDAAVQANPQVDTSLLTDQVIIITAVVSALVGLVVVLLLGAGVGALGGLLGRQRYRPAAYQESMYQGLPPPPVG
jgi:hypothetical protein